MIRITKEQVLALHDKSIERFGGLKGIRDEGLFESSCVAPYQTMFGNDLYPDIYDKAIRYLEGFATNQVFIDGNKRTAVACMMLLLRLNGIYPKLSNKELSQLCLDFANKLITKEAIKDLLINRS